MSVGQVVRPPWNRVGSAAGDPAAEPPVQPRRVWGQVMAAALVVLLAVALVGVVAARRLAEAEAVNDAPRPRTCWPTPWCSPRSTDGLLTGDPAAFARWTASSGSTCWACRCRPGEDLGLERTDRLLRRAGA